MPTFNTTDPKPGYVYDSAIDTWFPLVGIAPASEVDRWTKTVAGGETSLSGEDDNSVSLSYTAGTEQVYLNGVLLARGSDYTATNGTTITGLTALAASDIAEVITFNPSNILTTDAVIATDFEAKGDLISASAASTPVRLPVGTTGQVLKANSATTSGLEWGSVDADIEGVTAGTGISGGGTSGTVTITNSMATAIDAKGDLVAGTGADAFARLGVGANGTVLTAASGETTGLSWAAPVTGGMTSIATGTLSGTSTSITGIPSGYIDLVLLVNDPFVNIASAFGFRVNSISTANHEVRLIRASGTNLTGSAGDTYLDANGNNVALPTSSSTNSAFFYVKNYTTTLYKNIQLGYSSSVDNWSGLGFVPGLTAAVTSIQVVTRNGTSTFSGGTYTLYGVK